MEKPIVLIVDDDAANNAICEIVVKKALLGAPVEAFTSPDVAFEFIMTELPEKTTGPIILIMDIAMPVISGWDFLDCFQSLDKKFVERFTIIVLTASTDKSDYLKASLHPLVHSYIVKPLTISSLSNALPKMARKRRALSSLAFL